MWQIKVREKKTSRIVASDPSVKSTSGKTRPYPVNNLDYVVSGIRAIKSAFHAIIVAIFIESIFEREFAALSGAKPVKKEDHYMHAQNGGTLISRCVNFPGDPIVRGQNSCARARTLSLSRPYRRVYARATRLKTRTDFLSFPRIFVFFSPSRFFYQYSPLIDFFFGRRANANAVSEALFVPT